MKLHLHRFQLETKSTFKIARASYNVRDLLVVELRDGEFSGLGEASDHSFYNVKVDELWEIFQNLKPKIESLVYVANRIELVELVEQSIIDGYFEDPTVFAFETRTENRDFKLAKCKLAKFAPVSLMFSKKTVSKELIPVINRAIEKIKKTDKYQRDWGWKF